MSRVLVIGASGKTGRHVVAGLVARDVAVRAASRTPAQLRLTGAHPVRFDWHDDSTWGNALAGVDGVYLVKPESADVVEIVGEFLNVMSAVVGVRRVVLLSESATQTRPGDTAERQVELLVEASDLDWTILRPNWYMEDIVDEDFFGPMVRNDRVIVMTTGGSATAWIDARDVAEVAAEVLANGGSESQALDLTGPEALTLEQLAERITSVAGVSIKAFEETLSEAEKRMRAEGLDGEFVTYMSRISQSIIDGHTATITGDVERVTGRPPRSINAFLSEHAAQLHAAK